MALKKPIDYHKDISQKHRDIYESIKDGDKIAFDKKIIGLEAYSLFLWSIIAYVQCDEKDWLWVLSYFFIISSGLMWCLRITWVMFRYGYNYIMNLEADRCNKQNGDK